MHHQSAAFAVLTLALSVNAHAAAPSVAVDIAPLHSLVSQVMGDVAEPNLLIPAGASPHHYTLRPSEATALEDANVVFWIGERLSPWLGKSIENLAGSAESVEVLSIEGTTSYLSREGATFEGHDHEGEEEHGDEHDEGKEEHDDEHDEAKDEHEDEHHDSIDPHAWLDPENAKLWVSHISAVLSKQDPENASTYAKNAVAATVSLEELIETTSSQIQELGDLKFIVFHDAYQHFEKRFGISAAGSIKLGDAEDPSPARIKEVQELVNSLNVTCVYTEPQFNPGIVETVFEGTSVTTSGVMDPLGASLDRGSELYPQLIRGMVNSLSQCK